MTEPQERRSSDALLVLVQSIHKDLKSLDRKLTAHIETEPAEWAAQLESLIGKAFPNGDADGHREAHEAQMTAIRDRAAFWKAMLLEVSKWGVLGVLGWMAYHLWAAFIQGPK